MNADPVRNPPTPGFATRTGAALGRADAQPANHGRAQFATRHGLDGGVAGRETCTAGVSGGPPRSCARNLLW